MLNTTQETKVRKYQQATSTHIGPFLSIAEALEAGMPKWAVVRIFGVGGIWGVFPGNLDIPAQWA